MAPSLHATLGASSAYRWMTCPGSIRLSAGMPNESNVYAREGSAAHEIGERALNDRKPALHYLGVKLPDYPDIEVDESMCAAVQEYLDVVWGAIAAYEEAGHDDWELGVEVRFDLRHIYPEMFGTCDCTIYFPAWKKLIVIDYKHGWISVPVERNPQTMYYAVGALTGKHNRAIEKVELIIVQPRSGHDTIVKRWTCGAIEIIDYIGDLVKAAEATEAADAPLNPGEWCKFCPAAPLCRALLNFVEEQTMAFKASDGSVTMPDPDKLSFDQLKQVWLNARIIESWVKNVKAYAHSQALNGNMLPGTKLIEGRSNRKWRDEEKAARKLALLQKLGDIEGEVYSTKLKSPKQVEDMMPKAARPALAGLWTKGRGALTLVPETDEGEAVKADAFKEFL